MRLLAVAAILCVMLFVVACVPEPTEEINITVEKEVEEVEEDEAPLEEITTAEVPDETLSALDEEPEPEPADNQTSNATNQTNTTSSPSPITGGAVASAPRTVVADGMIEVQEGESIRVIIPD